MPRKVALVLTVGYLALILFACNRSDIAPSVRAGNGPSFSFHGSGRIIRFAVYAPPPGSGIASPFNTMWMLPDAEVAPIIWQIECADSYLRRVGAEGLVLSYGLLPTGCLQKVPENGPAPPPSPKAIYSYSVETFYGRSTAFANGDFYVDPSGNVWPVEVADLCLERTGARETRVNCKTHKAYVEPEDVPGYAREHRER